MPKKKKSSGFSHQKSGKRGGSGFKGRRKWSDDDQGEGSLNDERPRPASGLSQHESDSQESFSSVICGTQDDVTVSGPLISISDQDEVIPPSSSPTVLAADPNSGIHNPADSFEATRFNVINSPHDISFPPLSSPGLSSRTTELSIHAIQGEDREATTANVTSMDTGYSLTDTTNMLDMLSALLPLNWKCLVGTEGFRVVLMSRGIKNTAIQREVYASFMGSIEVFIHRKVLSEELYKDCLKDVKKLVSINESPKDFCDNIVKVVYALRSLEICAGSDHKVMFEEIWAGDTSGMIDNNPYGESRYEKTFRSNECTLLVPVHTWRCRECVKASKRFRDRFKHHQDEEVKKHTKNEYLDPKQAQFKLKALQLELKSARKKIDYWSTRVSEALNQDGVYVDSKCGEDLTNILRDWGKLNPVQQLFIQQQVKSASCKGASGMRWHPTMIRLALSIQSTSNAAFIALRDSGMVQLPSQRTLFDYSHAVPRSEGIFKEKIQNIGNKVKNFEEEHQKYFTLMFDEIHISQKLVYRKSDGSLVGYVKLEEAEIEMQNLMDTLNNNQKENFQPAVATKILAYMIKGCTSNYVKEVIAAFPTSNLTKEQLFSRTWDVIRQCEGKGIKILALVCDGSSINRAFIAMHTPATPSLSGVVFDTVHLCAPDRKIFFISDPPHLLKTIRNCFANSGTGKRCTRFMKIGKEFIQWITIIRLYSEDVDEALRRCYKLNSQNVYLNSYTCMKVSYAAQVMSRTVAMDLKDRNWPGTEATVNFILKVNDFFDCLNGSHMDIARQKANDRLKPYTCEGDERFKELKDFEKYVRDWEREVQDLRGYSKTQKGKMTLSSQTIEGISITVNGFIGVVKFLLSVGAKYVHGRAFCQDPLEQYFSKQRASLGGRNNPTVDSFMSTDSKISAHRDFNVKRRSGNTTSTPSAMEIDCEPLPKRRKVILERRKSL